MNEQALTYHLCPQCYRATPTSAKEVYCPNDGAKLLAACPKCGLHITSPYARFCSACGRDFGSSKKDWGRSL